MNARTRLAELIGEYHSFEEPYDRIHSRNPQDLALKLDFCRAGEKMCGGPHQFALWFVFTFSPETLYNVPPEEYEKHTGKVMANIPRAMYGPILGYMNYISSFDSLVLPTTLDWWWKVGEYRFSDFIDRHSGIIAGETLFRTRFPNRMTEHEAMHMILLWLPSNKRQPATQTPPEPFIHAPMVLCLPKPSVQVVPLLPAITDTPLMYGCDQFIRVPVEIDAAPAFAGKDNRTREVTVRVIEVEDDEIEIVFEPDEELTALIQEPVKIPSRLEHVIEMEKKLHATRKARILEIEAEVCQFFELERFAFRTTTGKFTSTVIDQQDAETLRGYLVHLESKYDSMKSRQALGDRRESRRLGKTG